MAEYTSRSQRSLYVLAGLTAAAALTAMLTVFSSDEAVQTEFVPVLMFPELSDKINSVARISMKTPTETFDVTLDRELGWVLPSKRNFPADEDSVRQLLLGLADLKLIEPKTARPELHRQIGLGDPGSGGSGVHVAAFDGRGVELASMVVGDRHRGSGTAGVSVVYVRKPDEDQTWLARGRLSIERELANWIETDLFEIDRKDVHSVSVDPSKGKSYGITRTSVTGDAFALDSVPEGRRSRAPYSINPVAYALPTLQIDDVVSSEEFSFETEATTIYNLFNGTRVTVALGEQDDAYYASFSAEAGEPVIKPDDEEEAEQADDAEKEEEDADPASEASSEDEVADGETLDDTGIDEEAEMTESEEDEAAPEEDGAGESDDSQSDETADVEETSEGTEDAAVDAAEAPVEEVTTEELADATETEPADEDSEALEADGDGDSDNLLDSLLNGDEEEEPEISADEQTKLLNARLEGWVFEVPEFKYQQLTKPLEDLLEPLPEDGSSE